MCGIFGLISNKSINIKDTKILSNHARQRGKDSSGFLTYSNESYYVDRYDFDIKDSIKKINLDNKRLIIGHSRLVTNSMKDNQPIYENNICVFHNGIITNFENLFKKFNLKPKLQIDSEIIASLINYGLKKNYDLNTLIEFIKKELVGSASCVVTLLETGKIILFTNNGSLYYGKKDDSIYISSEKFPLVKTDCFDIKKVNSTVIFDIPKNDKKE